MATAVEQAIAEIDERLATFAPQHEGLRDYFQLNLQEATKREISTAIDTYDRRVDRLTRARQALVDLMADGHPDLAVREISTTAFKDLQDNARTIEAALARFASNAAVGLNLEAGKTENK
jgi:hypothetical protein